MSDALEQELEQSVEAEAEVEASGRPLAGKAVANMALRGLSMAARFLLLIGLAHFLTADQVGVFSLMYASTTLGILLLGARFDIYSTRAICSNERSSAAVVIRDQIVFHLILYALILPAMLAVFATGLLPWSLAPWFYTLTILEHVGQECHRLFIALGRPLHANFIFFLRNGLWALVLIAMMKIAPGSRGLESLWVLWAVGGVASLLVSAAWMRGLGWRSALKEPVDWNWIKRGIKPSAAFTLAVGATTVITSADRYFLQGTWSRAHVGVYAFYSNLTNFIPAFADTGIVAILLPAILAASAAADQRAYDAIMVKLKKGILAVTLGCAALSVVLAPLVLMLVRKEQIYRTYLPAFGSLLLSTVLLTIAFVPHYGLYAKRQEREIARWTILAMVVALVCFATLSRPLGIYGICIGMIASSVTQLTGKAWALRRSEGRPLEVSDDPGVAFNS